MTDQELIRGLRTESLYKDKATLEIMDLCMEAANRLTAVLGELERVTRERDVAVEDLRVASIEGDMACNWCAGQTDRTRCYNCSFANEWKWRGQKEAET